MKLSIIWVRKFWQEDCSAIFSRSASHLLPIQKPFDISIEATSLPLSFLPMMPHSLTLRPEVSQAPHLTLHHPISLQKQWEFPSLSLLSQFPITVVHQGMINCYHSSSSIQYRILLNTSLFSSKVESPDSEPGSFFVQNFSQRTRIVLRAGGIWDAKMKAAEPVITTLRCVPSHQGDLEDSNQTLSYA